MTVTRLSYRGLQFSAFPRVRFSQVEMEFARNSLIAIHAGYCAVEKRRPDIRARATVARQIFEGVAEGSNN